MKAMSPTGWMILALALVAFVSLVSTLIFSKTVKNWFKGNSLGATVLCVVSIALGAWAVLAESTAKSMVPVGGFALLWAVFFLALARRRRGMNSVILTLVIIGSILFQQNLAAANGNPKVAEKRIVGKYKVVANSEAEAIEKAKQLALAEYAESNPRILDAHAVNPAPNDGQAGDGQAVFTPAAWWIVVVIIIIVAVVMIVKIAQFCNEHFPRNQAPPVPGGAGFVADTNAPYFAAYGTYGTTDPGSCANSSTAAANTGTFQLNATVSANGSNVTVTGSSYQLNSVTKTVFQEGLRDWGLDLTNSPVVGNITYARNGVPVPADGHPVTIVGATVKVNNQTGNAQPTATVIFQTSPDLAKWTTLVTLSGVPGGQQLQFQHVPQASRQFYRLLSGVQAP